MWSRPLVEVIRAMSLCENAVDFDFKSLAERLNQANALHAGELLSFQDAYSAEVRGLVDSVAKDMAESGRLEAIKSGRTSCRLVWSTIAIGLVTSFRPYTFTLVCMPASVGIRSAS
jgi:hypothetical protein